MSTGSGNCMGMLCWCGEQLQRVAHLEAGVSAQGGSQEGEGCRDVARVGQPGKVSGHEAHSEGLLEREKLSVLVANGLLQSNSGGWRCSCLPWPRRSARREPAA